MKRWMLLLGFLAISSLAWAGYKDCGDKCPPCPECPPVQERVMALKAVEPVVVDQGCNCFTFDSGKSSDADGDALSSSWEFSDGTKAEGQVVQKCFEKAGSYTASLIVRDGNEICGTGATTANVIAEFPPQANAGEDMTICLETVAKFDGSKSSDGVVGHWDYGDNSSGEGLVGSHTYSAPGNYVAVLTVSNPNGGCGSATDTVLVSVKSKPVAVIEVS